MPSTSTETAESKDICQFYNPYFGTGCIDGTGCKLRHLKKKDYILFCTRMNKEHKADEDTRNTFRSAIDLLKKGQPQSAILKFKEILDICPYDELYNMWCARCCEELKQYDDAEFYYRKSIAIQPKFATAHGRYAEFSWHKLNNIQQADIHFQKSLSNKENHVTHRHYAQFLEQNFNDYRKSQFHFERCLELSPKDHGAHHSYAIVLQKMGADSNVIKHHYETSIALYDCANVQYSYALYLKNIRENEAAVKHFRCAIQHDARNAMYHFQIGQFLYHEMGRKDEGLNHIQNACALAPSQDIYLETLRKLQAQSAEEMIQHQSEVSTSRPNSTDSRSRDSRRGVLPERSCWGDRNTRSQLQLTPTSQITESKQRSQRSQSEFKEMVQDREISIQNKELQFMQLSDQQIAENENLHEMKQSRVSKQCENALTVPMMDDHNQMHQFQYQVNQHQDQNQNQHRQDQEQGQRQFLLDDPLSNDFQEYLTFEKVAVEEPQQTRCQFEFERFVAETFYGAAGQDYIQRFAEKQMNDIRVLEFVDYDFLKNEIGMAEIHTRMMIKKIDKFKRDMETFTQWMHSLQLYDEYFEKLELQGIITLDLLYEYIKQPQDLTEIIGNENTVDAMYLYHNTPKQCRHLAFQENQQCIR